MILVDGEDFDDDLGEVFRIFYFWCFLKYLIILGF